MLYQLADLLEQSLEELAQAESRDQGEGCALWKVQYDYSDAGDSYPHSSCRVTWCLLTTMDGDSGHFHSGPPGPIRLAHTCAPHGRGGGGQKKHPEGLQLAHFCPILMA